LKQKLDCAVEILTFERDIRGSH